MSNLDTEADIVTALTKHIREIIQARDNSTACAEGIVLSLVQGLIQNMEDLQQSGLRLSRSSENAILDARDATMASDIYFLACTLHLEVEIDETKAH